MPAPPNILWIVTTQWRASATGYAGDSNARTPCLDALAAESVNYAQAVTPHPFGPFARAALLTGVPSPDNGVRDYFDMLPAGSRTVAHELKARGYATAFFGKWGVGRRDPRVPLVGEEAAKVIVPEGERGGFDFFEGFEGGFQLNNPWLNGTRLPQPTEVSGYQSDIVCERAADFCGSGFLPDVSGINPDLQKPSGINPGPHGFWFCVVSLEAPHPPYAAPAAGILARDPKPLTLAPNVPSVAEARARRELAGYHAHVEATDRAIGRLVAGAPRDTIVVFTSVHGDMHGAHGLFRKGWPHEESIRVPLLIRAPGESPRRDDAPVSLLDLSELTLARIENRKSQIKNQRGARISMPSVVALPDQCDRAWRGVRTATRKLVLNADGSPWLFFDLERDPLELKNLAADPAFAAEIAALRAQV